MNPGFCVAAVLLAGSATAAEPPQTDRPRAALIIVVDQMRADYITRFAPYFTGGLKRLITEGVVFDSASHEHANTETAVGHATLSTGCFPMHHGIVGNDFYDRTHDRIVYAVEDTTTRIIRTTTLAVKLEDSLGSSAHYLLRPSVANWLKNAGIANRVYSMSLKDRAAILMAGLSDRGGPHPDGVYWWDRKSGDFVTSTAYADSLPDWVNQFNRSGLKNNWNDSVWTRIGDSAMYNLIGAENVPQENDGIHTTFPHAFMTERANRKAFDALYYTPYADQLLITFARELVKKENLGKGTGFDMIMVSCSAADAVGHSYGPQSQEIFDYYLRLDKYLDTLLNEMDSSIGRNDYIAVLTSDHGCAEMPADSNRVAAKKADSAIYASLRTIQNYTPELDSLTAINGAEIDFHHKPGVTDSLVAVLNTAVANGVRQAPWVESVLSGSEMLTGPEGPAPIEQMAHNCYALPNRVPDLLVVLKPGYIVTSSLTGTTHGSPYWYDRHVPLVFWGSVMQAKHIAARVRTVDMAPTLAELIGISPTDSIDGKSLLPLTTQ